MLGQGSKMSNVYIKIGGLTNTGKTSVAVIIEKALIEAGFNVKPFTNRDGDADTKRQWLTEGKLPIKTSEINIELEEVRLVRKLTDE
jgi:adenylylsulfate kinase-like enzyme